MIHIVIRISTYNAVIFETHFIWFLEHYCTPLTTISVPQTDAHSYITCFNECLPVLVMNKTQDLYLPSAVKVLSS